MGTFVDKMQKHAHKKEIKNMMYKSLLSLHQNVEIPYNYD